MAGRRLDDRRALALSRSRALASALLRSPAPAPTPRLPFPAPLRCRSPPRSRSRSPTRLSERKRRRPTWFDIAPVNGLPPPWSTLPGAVQVVPQEVAASNVGNNAFVTVASQQATRHARRVYVGGLPPSVTERSLGDFFTCVEAAEAEGWGQFGSKRPARPSFCRAPASRRGSATGLPGSVREGPSGGGLDKVTRSPATKASRLARPRWAPLSGTSRLGGPLAGGLSEWGDRHPPPRGLAAQALP